MLSNKFMLDIILINHHAILLSDYLVMVYIVGLIIYQLTIWLLLKYQLSFQCLCPFCSVFLDKLMMIYVWIHPLSGIKLRV